MAKLVIFFLLFFNLFLFSCGGGGSNSNQSSLNANKDQNAEVNNSSEDTITASQVQTVIVENRFGECNFGECKFE